MNKKGFTLVELLAVIVILSVIMILVVPNIQNALGTSKNKLVELNKDTIKDSAKILVNEVITCDMSETTKNIVGNSCSQAKTKLINGINNINIDDLEIEKVSDRCSGTIDIKMDSETYRAEINTDKIKCDL